MKTLAAVVFFALSLYLLPNPTHSTFNPIRLRTADNAAEPPEEAYTPVLDINGEEVYFGKDYYIFAARVLTESRRGGLKLAHLVDDKCASNVIVSPDHLDKGDPIRFTPLDWEIPGLIPSSPLSIFFNVVSGKFCESNVRWAVQYYSGKYVLKAREFNNLNDQQFKIEVVNADLNIYKFTYCKSGGDYVCNDVGTYSDPFDETTRLVLIEDDVPSGEDNIAPFVFWILKASDV